MLTFCRAQINIDIFSLAFVESSLVETPPFVTCQSLVIAVSCYTDCWLAYTSRSLLLRVYRLVGLGFVTWQEKDFFSQRFQPALSHIELPINRAPGYLIRDRRPGRHVDLSFSSSAQVKNEWSCISTPPTCLYGMCGDNFTHYTQEAFKD